jgi:hypothetical protein
VCDKKLLFSDPTGARFSKRKKRMMVQQPLKKQPPTKPWPRYNKWSLTTMGFNRKRRRFQPGLPDFSWYKVPKRGKIYQITTKYTYLMVIKYPKRL